MFTDLLHTLTRHDDLTADQAAAAMDLVMTGQATPAQLAAQPVLTTKCSTSASSTRSKPAKSQVGTV